MNSDTCPVSESGQRIGKKSRMSSKRNNKDAIYKAVENSGLIEDGQHIVLGLSGGSDSVCLFNVLKEMTEEKEIRIYPVHVNHMIRGEAADKDQTYVENLCRQNKMECEVVKFDCEKMAKELGITTEEAGRRKRYKTFSEFAERIAKDKSIDKKNILIATAHNEDDRVETILFRILRGTGIDGLSGINAVREAKAGCSIIRPLLEVKKSEINKYCEERSLNPCKDNTNEQTIYARNRIRLELLPYLKEYNPNIEEALLRLGLSAGEDSKLLTECSGTTYEIHLAGENSVEIIFDDELKTSAAPLYRRAIARGFAKLGLEDDITFAHFELMDNVMKSSNPSASANLPRGYKFSRRYDKLILSKPVESGIKPPLLRKETVTMESYHDSDYEKGMFAAFDAGLLESVYGENFTDKVEIRTRNPGDFLNQSNGRKKLQNLFVDEKVPKVMRDNIFFVAIGSEVLFIPNEKGVLNNARYGSKYSLSANTKNAFVVEIFSSL